MNQKYSRLSGEIAVMSENNPEKATRRRELEDLSLRLQAKGERLIILK